MAKPQEDSNVLPLVRPSAPAPAAETAIGEVVEPRDSSRGGRALVRWSTPSGRVKQRWASAIAGVEPVPGQRVLLSHPSNWPEPVITGCLAVEGHASLRLQPGQHLTIQDAEGLPLVEVHSSEQGPVMKFVHPNVGLHASGRLQLKAERIELQAADGGVSVSADGDTIVRGRTIQLN